MEGIGKIILGICEEGVQVGWSQVPFSGCPVTEPEARSTNRNTRSLDSNHLYTVRVTKHWCRLSRTLMESASLEKLKSHLNMVLGKQLISLPRHSKACLISEKEEPMNRFALTIWNSAHISSSKGRYARTHGFSHYCGRQQCKGNNLQ